MFSFKDGERIIRDYALKYNKSKIIEIKGLGLLNDFVSEKGDNYIDSIDKYKYYYSVQEKIDAILEQMSWDNSNFLRNEFFSSNKRYDWWTKFYSRSTYYRLKKKSMQEFLRLLYD